jgi:hypothetical protein
LAAFFLAGFLAAIFLPLHLQAQAMVFLLVSVGTIREAYP